jgi:hypothetical protein
MKFEEAMGLLRSGWVIRRQRWTVGNGIRKVGDVDDLAWCNERDTGRLFLLGGGDLFADDWEELREGEAHPPLSRPEMEPEPHPPLYDHPQYTTAGILTGVSPASAPIFTNRQVALIVCAFLHQRTASGLTDVSRFLRFLDGESDFA